MTRTYSCDISKQLRVFEHKALLIIEQRKQT